jgi:SAM-dependent methyltransferase
MGEVTACAICGGARTSYEFVAREMMFGLRDEFRYVECADCGCVQRVDEPTDLSRYYPPSYYSFERRPERRFKRALKALRLQHLFGRESVPGRLLVWWFGAPADAMAVARAEPGTDQSILDVGCGQARLLYDLRALGFRDLTGIDPYLPEAPPSSDGLVLLKQHLEEVRGSFDWVMMHHSLEHMAEPLDALRHVHRLLAPEGRALIRIPVAGSYAWRTYGADWVQLDAPRHTFLHTPRSFEILGEAGGFAIESIVYDSSAFQFWGSEQYRLGIPLHTGAERSPGPRPGLFSRSELRRFEHRAASLNAIGDGDQACFLLRKS